MGILDVNMPLLYGEGEEKAFRRLQVEFLKTTEDDSLLMHQCLEDDSWFAHWLHPLASSPRGFRGLGAIKKGGGDPLFHGRRIAAQMMPNGLQVQLPVCPCKVYDDKDQWRAIREHGENPYIAIVNCTIPGSYLDRPVIVLNRLPDGSFVRYFNTVMPRLEPESREVKFTPSAKGMRNE
jgi:hypothetical protein